MPTLSNIHSPLSIGDIVGRSFRIFRQNIWLIARALLLPTVLLCLGRVGFIMAATNLSRGAAGFQNLPLWILVMLGGVLVLLAGGFILSLRQLALVRLFTGFAASYDEARKFANTRLGAVIGLGLAAFAASILIILFWAVLIGLAAALLTQKNFIAALGLAGATAGATGALLSLTFMSIVVHLAISSMAIEKDDLGTIITHSLGLSSRAVFRSFLFLIITTASVSLLAYPLSVPLVALVFMHTVTEGMINGTHHSASQMPMYMQIISQVWEQLISMIVTPISFTCFGLYYCDLRTRQEGLDLIERVDDLVALNGRDFENDTNSSTVKF